MPITLQELAETIDASLVGDGSVQVHGCAPIQNAGPGEVTFLANRAYTRFLRDTRAAAVMVDPATQCPDGLNRLVVKDPYFAFRNAMVAIYGHRRHPDPIDAARADGDLDAAMISPRAVVHPSATIGARVRVHSGVTVEAGASIGADTVLYPGVYVGPEARIGEASVLHPNVVVYDHCIIGNRVVLHANTTVGQDGFGYATHGGRHHKIPQAGIVVIEDDVELGAGCAIERAAMGETRIGAGTKFADLISIGHGTTIGRHCLLVSLVGISGSVDVGNYVVLGGQVGVSGHLRIGDGVQVAAKAGVVGDVPPGMKIGGVPAIELNVAKRNALASTGLAELARRVRELERKVAKDEGG